MALWIIAALLLFILIGVAIIATTLNSIDGYLKLICGYIFDLNESQRSIIPKKN